MTARDTDLSRREDTEQLLNAVRSEYARQARRRSRLRFMWAAATILALTAAAVLIKHLAGLN